MNERAQNPDELGALWIKSGAKGDYLTGTINGQPVVVFRNDRKAPGSKAPDWRVLKAKPKDGAAPRATSYASQSSQFSQFSDDDPGF